MLVIGDSPMISPPAVSVSFAMCRKARPIQEDASVNAGPADAGTTAVRAAHRFDEARLTTLGHPLADFAYHAMMYRVPPEMVAGLAGADLVALNIPAEAHYVAAYCRPAGRPMIPPVDYNFYLAFNFFRIAAILHGIKGRVARGTAASAQAHERVKVFPELA